MVEDVECQANWEDMFSFVPTLDREAGEFTVQDVITQLGVTPNRAAARCRDLLADGYLQTGKRYNPETGRIARAYWRTGGRVANWQELFVFVPTLNREAGEFTVQDVARRFNAMRKFDVSANQAMAQCRQLLESGQLETGQRYDPESGRIVTAYWRKRGQPTA